MPEDKQKELSHVTEDLKIKLDELDRTVLKLLLMKYGFSRLIMWLSQEYQEFVRQEYREFKKKTEQEIKQWLKQ